MKDSAYPVQRHSNPRALAFRYLGAKGDEKHFDIPPSDIRSCRVGEDHLQRPKMFRCQMHSINL